MNTHVLCIVVAAVAACSSSAKSHSSGPSTSPAGPGTTGEAFLTQIYAPPAQPLVACPGGVPATLAPEWHSMKADDRTSPANVYVQLDAEPSACKIGIGEFPRLCKNTDGWSTTCTNHDGSRPHIGQLRCTPTDLEIWVIAPEGEVRIATLPRPASATCHGT